MNFIMENWFILVAAVASLAVCGYVAYTYTKMPTTEQIKKVKEWLLYAVAAAEKEFGGGTGQIKLRYVYDMFLMKFPEVACLISFDTFSSLVDGALEKFKDLLNSNVRLQSYIEK